MKKFIKIMFWLIVTPFLLFVGFILYITLTDYRPDPTEVIMENEVSAMKKDTFSMLSWNIGYAGLGAEMDFFYDGGKKVRPSMELNEAYLEGILDFLAERKEDFILVQEVDRNSRRSYWKDQAEVIGELMPGYTQSFTLNYKVPFVPVPPTEPMGKVNGGMMTLSKQEPYRAERIAYPLIASWPQRLFLLDRCFILSRFRLVSGNDLVIINTHNSAYVFDTALRNQEFNIIRQAMIDEYEKGNFVVAGGDWNANPPAFKPAGNFNGHRHEPGKIEMRSDFLPVGWKWAYGSNAPTNRLNEKSFSKGTTGTTVIDYFVVSPNVWIEDIQTIDLDFKHSDHNPVYLKINLTR
jgi:endonuclease/exonuclease/phosphatase family metal-dependent hydrolase